jgi:Neuraminidase (sialidase)
MVSEDGGKSWEQHGRRMRDSDDVRPGNIGSFIAGYHPSMVDLADGRWMAFGRLDGVQEQARFENRMPVSYSSDRGKTWRWDMSEFPVVSSAQKHVLLRLREGPLLLCSFTDQWRDWKNRKGLVFKSTAGEYNGYGLFAAVSYDEGKTWRDRRLLAPEGKNTADGYGYLASTQTRDGRIHLITSKDHYVFNIAWITALPRAPTK